MKNPNTLKIFIASPSDCILERNIIRELAYTDPTIRGVCDTFNYKLVIRGWEDIESDVGRPQSLINNDITDFDPDWVVFIFWSKIGTDAGKGWTGTEEEWKLAVKMNKKGNNRPRVSLFLNDASIPEFQRDELQITKLKKFIGGVFNKHQALAKKYNGVLEFECIFRSYIVKYIINNNIKINPDLLKKQLREGSEDLLKWQSTLVNGKYIVRKEIDEIIGNINNNESTTQLILGPKGTGKSSLLSVLGNKLVNENVILLCIKADVLPPDIDNLDRLSNDFLNLNINLSQLIEALALDQKIVIIIDQLDALCELTDQKTNRLNMLLKFIKKMSRTSNIHIIASSRDFEYRLDTRLSNIDAIPIYLSLPEWDDIESNVKDIGFDTFVFSSTMKELLRVPLHLDLFLKVASPGDVFESLHGLLNAVWGKEVERGESNKKVELIEQLALRMSEEEIFWISLTMIDGYGYIVTELLSSEILVLSEDKKSIGFRHQTYLDFVMTKIFAKKGLRFSQYIFENQDNLFIRGSIISTLNYMRTAVSKTYNEEIIELFKTKPRKHLWILLIEFLGSQINPSNEEKEFLERILNTEEEGPIVLRSISNSPALIEYFIARNSLISWMQKAPEEARFCLPVLCSAAVSGNQRLTKLLIDTWVSKFPTYNHLILSVLLDYRDWDTESLSIMHQLIKTDDSYYIHHILGNIAQVNKREAILLYKKNLEKKYFVAVQESENHIVDKDQSVLFDSKRTPFEKLLTKYEHYITDILSLAEAEPEFFLSQIWDLFITVLDKAAYDEHEWVNEYRQDHADHNIFNKDEYYDSFGDSILTAIISFAKKRPKKFSIFLKKNEGSNLMLVHQLLSIGMIELSSSYSDIIAEYLLSDERRLGISKGGSSHYFTNKLIIKIYNSISIEIRKEIENYIIKYNHYKKSMPDWNASDRRDRMLWNRQHRLYLLKSLRLGEEPVYIKKLIDEEIRALGDLEDNEGTSWGGFIGARISQNEMSLAKDEDILSLFNKLTDKQMEEHPSNRFNSNDYSRSGGARQLGNIFKEFSKMNIERSIQLIHSLSPDKHQIYVGSAIEGLSESEISSDRLYQIIYKFIDKGYGNNEFIISVSNALNNIASTSGLPDQCISILKKWLQKINEPTDNQYQASKSDENNSSVLFGHGRNYLLPGGRGIIMRAIGFGYLSRKRPAINKYILFLKQRLHKETHAAVWSSSIYFLQYCLSEGQKTKAMEIYSLIVDLHPNVFLYDQTLYSLPRLFKINDFSSIQHRSLDIIKEIGLPHTNQAYGELLFLYLFYHNDTLGKEHINNELRILNPKVILGLAYAVSGLWKHFTSKDFLIEILDRSIDLQDEHINSAIGNIFYEVEETDMDDHFGTLIDKICLNRILFKKVSNSLIEYISNIVGDYPDLSYKVAMNFLRYYGDEITDISSSLAQVADDLTSIAISLQRNTLHRTKGIELFEWLLSINAREAKEAISLLERLPTSSVPNPKRFRRRKRRKKKL